MPQVSNDVISDIFRFLERNEVERNQLVCQRWFNIVEKYASILPLRLFENCSIMKFGDDPYACVTLPESVRTYTLLDGDFSDVSLIKGLKNCIAKILITRAADYGIVLEVLQRLIEIIGRPLRVVLFEPNVHDQREFRLTLTQTIDICRHLIAYKVKKLIFNRCDYMAFFDMANQKLDWTRNVELDFRLCENIYAGVLDLGTRLIDMFNNGLKHELYCFTLAFFADLITEDELKTILNAYMEAKEPFHIAKAITLYDRGYHARSVRSTHDVKKLIKNLDTSSVGSMILDSGSKNKTVYMLKTKYGHLLKISFTKTYDQRDLKESYIKIKLIPKEG